jgi:sodium/glucose cotransporter 9
MGVEFSYSAPACGSDEVDNRPDVITKVHYLMFAIILATVSLVVTVAVTIVTPPRTKAQLRRVTWWTRHDLQQPDLTDSDSESSDEDPESADKGEQPAPAMGKFRRVYSLICGSSPVPEKLTKEQKLQMALDMTSITENPFWSRVCDYNAVIAVGVTCFIIGFYA